MNQFKAIFCLGILSTATSAASLNFDTYFKAVDQGLVSPTWVVYLPNHGGLTELANEGFLILSTNGKAPLTRAASSKIVFTASRARREFRSQFEDLARRLNLRWIVRYEFVNDIEKGNKRPQGVRTIIELDSVSASKIDMHRHDTDMPEWNYKDFSEDAAFRMILEGKFRTVLFFDHNGTELVRPQMKAPICSNYIQSLPPNTFGQFRPKDFGGPGPAP